MSLTGDPQTQDDTVMGIYAGDDMQRMVSVMVIIDNEVWTGPEELAEVLSDSEGSVTEIDGGFCADQGLRACVQAVDGNLIAVTPFTGPDDAATTMRTTRALADAI